MPPRIALIHAVKVAIDPIEDAFRELWPETERINILDDSLFTDRSKSTEIGPDIMRRFSELGSYARGTGAAGILFTCSAFGEAIEAVAREVTIPVLKPNEAMFEAALDRGNVVGMLGTANAAIAGMEQEFRDLAERRGSMARIHSICVPAAMAALQKGDAATHNRLLADVAPELSGSDVVLLAHFSTSRAEAAVASKVKAPILTAPGAAVSKLKVLLGHG